MMNDMIGRTIGRYQIVEHLGRGGMAEVFKAYQASLDRYVALKLMHSFLAEDAEFFARFEREAKNIAALHHPNIIQIHDFDHEGSASYMVMEFVDGGTLKDRLNALAAKGETLPLAEAIRIIKDVGAALAFAHGAGMIHRDIKPANVLIDRKGRVILTDFGIAKMVSSAKFTASGSLLGTPAYMAPEQGLGQPGDHRADIYSLGVMLYQLVTGALPYEADTPVAVILKHVNEPLPMPRTVKPDLPVGLERIIAKAMAKEAAQRYQNVEDMLRDLNDLDKAALIPIPEATMVVNARTATGQIPVVSKAGGTPPPAGDSTVAISGAGASISTPVNEERRGSPVMPIIIGVVIIGILALVGAALLAGPQLMAALQGPTATPIVITVVPGQTLPPDLSPEVLAAITQQAATAIAQQATIEALQATDTPAPTQDLTATALACPLDATVAQQTPPDGNAMTVGRENKISIQLKNSGECAWTEGTTFAFVEGDDPRGVNAADIQIPPTDAGATTTIELVFKPDTAKTYVSTWQVKLADGRAVGGPIKLTYVANPAPTARPTTVQATVPPRQTPTPVPEGGGLDAVSLRFRSCDYIDASFYECSVTVNITGGVAPWNVTINGANNGDLTFEQGSARSWLMSAQRCEAVTLEIIVIDGNNDQISNVQTFNPNSAAIFPGGSVCSP